MNCIIEGCKRETNSPSGVCVICQLDGKKPMEGAMARVAESKECIQCGKTYKPTSNVQKRCVECAHKHKREPGKKKPGSQKVRQRALSPVPIVKNIGAAVEIPIKPLQKLLLAQLLHASSLLDGQIDLAHKENAVDITVLTDVRMRIGEVIRGSLE